MTKVDAKQVADVVQRVQNWPPPLRIALARQILQTLEGPSAGSPSPAGPRGLSAAEVAAMFQTDQPAPNDEEVQRILEEELLRKHAS
jgi:hypothetical protein